MIIPNMLVGPLQCGPRISDLHVGDQPILCPETLGALMCMISIACRNVQKIGIWWKTVILAGPMAGWEGVWVK